jgi:type II secretory pathway pseudopilin PulG
MKLPVSQNSKGFTLIEVLTVVGLTAIIMFLVFGPVVHSFNLTRHAEVMVRAQDNARLVLNMVVRDLSNAMYVYDNTNDFVNLPVIDQNGNPVVVPVKYAKVDMVLPRMRAYCTSPNHPNNQPREIPRHYVDPTTGKENALFDEATPLCPYDHSRLEIRPVQPLTPDTKVVRYFIGLEDPNKPYANPYLSKLTAARDQNLYILYRAEFSPSDPELFPDVSPGKIAQNIHDPDFFNRPGFRDAWRKISRPIVTINDTDLIRIKYENGKVSVIPTVRFMPTPIYNDPLVPVNDNSDPEYSNSPPTVYKATYGHWILPYTITLEPEEGGCYFFTSAGLGSTSDDPPTDICIYRRDDTGSGWGSPVLMFNITRYMSTKDASPYGSGEIVPRQVSGLHRAFTVDTVKGTVNFAFPVVNSNLAGQLGRPISKVVDTGDVNASFTPAYPYRHVFINDPAVPGERILSNAIVIPSSVRILAPDATLPGVPNPPLVWYVRRPFLYEPEKNQFSVDPYADQDTGKAEIRFHTYQSLGRYEGPSLPEGDVYIYYEVQNNKAKDVLKASYVTKSLMTVSVGIRIYDPSRGKPEVVELNSKVRLKNIKT